MSRRRNLQRSGDEVCFSFGDPEPVRSERILDYLGVFMETGGEYYIPPVQFSGLARMRRANCQHGSCIVERRNLAANAYRGGALSLQDFRAAVTDFLSIGNAFCEVVRNGMGNITRLVHIPAINMRVRTFGKGFRRLMPGGKYIDFEPGEIVHVKEYDEIQQIYGIPE